MKLRECNVFMCVSFCPQRRSHVTITHDALDFTIQGPPWPNPLCTETPLAPAPQLVTSGCQDQGPVQTCSLEDPLGADFWWMVTEACTVGKQTVRIPLERFLVILVYAFK